MNKETYMHLWRSPQYSCLIQLLAFMETVGIVEDAQMIYGEHSLLLAVHGDDDEEDVDHMKAKYVAQWSEALYEDF